MQDDLFFGPDFFLEDEVTQKISLREGELREVAVLFADLKGFTNISNLFEPEVIHGKMDDIMKIFSRCISFYGGFVDKYMGDGIMALFGAKKATEQDTQRCVLAAIKMQEQLLLYNKLLNREPGFETVTLGLRIGINTGLVSVGKVGESREGDFTVYGPQVNLASRMESNAPVNRIMMPRRTMQLVEHIFEFESYGSVTVKGMDEPIDCWLVLGQRTEKHIPPKSVFIGRAPELDALESELRLSLDAVRIVGVKGDAGIGKSRLIREFCANHNDALVLQGHCSAISPAPFNIFTRIFENYFEIKHTNPAQTRKVALIEGLSKLAESSDKSENIHDCMPLIALLMEIRVPDPRVEQKGKDLLNHILNAVEILFLAIIDSAARSGKRVILIMDDVHLVDDASAQAIEFLLERLQHGKSSILVLTTYRLDYRIIPSITDHENFLELDIQPLAQEQISELLRFYAGAKNLSGDTLKLVSELSAGNPFYLEEWCNYIGSLPQSNLSEYPVPGNLHALILSRLDNLPQNLRLLLHKAAVIGNEFFVDILREVESRLNDPVNIESTLGLLEEHSLIMKLLGFDFSTYFFKHITTREVAYQTLLHQNRKLLHELTARAIETLFSSTIEDYTFVLADHYVKAELPDSALPYLLQGFDKAANIFDNILAIKLGKQLLEYMKESKPRAELMIKLADILWLTGKWAEAEQLIAEADSLLDEKSPLKCEIHRFNGVANFYKGDFDQALQHFKDGFAIAQKIEDNYQLCVAQSNLGIWFQHHEKYSEALEYHLASLVLAQEMNDQQRIAKTYSNLGLIYLEQDDPDEAYKAFEQSLILSRNNRYMRDESIALGNMGWACLHIGKLEDARGLLQQKLELATGMNDKLEMIKALGNLGNLSFEEEDYATALSYYEQSLAMKEKLGNRQEIERSREAVKICREKLSLHT